MNKKSFIMLYNDISKNLRELPKHLKYHGAHHTLGDVLPNAIFLGTMEDISKTEMLILKTAALLHDIGYLERYESNEEIATKLCKDLLIKNGYSNKEIQKIHLIIMATQLQNIDGVLIQNPDKDDILQIIMCDADLGSLGRPDFFITGENLRQELETQYGKKIDLKDWYQQQLDFQSNHSYFTKSAQKLWNQGKKDNIQELEKRILKLDN